MILNYRNILNEGYKQPLRSRIFKDEAYLVSKEKADKLFGDQNNSPRNVLIKHDFVPMKQSSTNSYKKVKSEFSEDEVKLFRQAFNKQRPLTCRVIDDDVKNVGVRTYPSK